MTRRLRVGLVCVAVLAAVVAVGKIEADRANHSQNAAFARLLARVGPHWDTTASAYRLAPTFDCLLYRVGPDPYALELCFDASGRIVEAADHRDAAAPTYWSLRFDPGASTVGVDPARLLAALVRYQAVPKGTTSIPLGHDDDGPTLVPPPTKPTPGHAK